MIMDPVFNEIKAIGPSAFKDYLEGDEEDIIDDSIYDIQDDKLKTE